MKKLVFFTVLMSLILTAFEWNSKSKDNGVDFKDVSFEQALKLADESEKYVFMDAYASWCGPCKMMDRNTFTTSEVGEAFNEHFVSIKVDMEKGEGPALARKYQVRAYPTTFILNTKGEVQKRIVGYRGPEDMLKELAEFID